jgi:hypothetical protein
MAMVVGHWDGLWRLNDIHSVNIHWGIPQSALVPSFIGHAEEALLPPLHCLLHLALAVKLTTATEDGNCFNGLEGKSTEHHVFPIYIYIYVHVLWCFYHR